MIVAALVGGVLGAVVLNLAYFVGVALVGAGAAALLLHLAWTHFAEATRPFLLVIAVSLAGAIAATQLQRLVIIVASAFGGAWTLIVGVLALPATERARRGRSQRRVGGLSASAGRAGGRFAAWLVLGVVGMAVQLTLRAGRRRRRRRRRRPEG